MARRRQVQMRFATVDDRDVMGGLALALLQEIDNPMFSAAEYAEAAGDLLSNNASFLALLAVADASPVGTRQYGDGTADREMVVGMLTMSESGALFAGGRFGDVQEFYIIPDYRGGGLGQLMLDRAAEEGRKRKWQRLQLNAPSPEKSARAYQFYRQYGFEDIGPLLRYALNAKT